jgi:hypothetical protein
LRITVRSVAACLGAAATVFSLAATVPSTGALAGEPPAWCTSSGELRAENLPERLPPYAGCDLTGRAVRSGNAVLTIQRRGLGVSIDGIGANAPDFSLATLRDGTVVVGHEDEGAQGNAALPPVDSPFKPDPCAAAMASAYSLLGHKAYSTIGWYYNGSGVPSAVASGAQGAFTAAAAAMAGGADDCGIAQAPRDSHQAYNGGTSRTPAVTATVCGTDDGFSVIGWGSMGSNGVLAATCTWYATDASPYRSVASDMLYNTTYPWSTDVTTCVGSGTLGVGGYDVKSVATHEWGHAFGLGHVSEAGTTATQTMSTNIDGTCEDNEATLGRGDLNGMLSLYGAV